MLPLGLFTWCPGCWVLLTGLDIQCCKMKLLNWVSHFCLTLTQKPRDSWSLTKGSQWCRFFVVDNMSRADNNASFEREIDLTVYLVTWHDRHLIHIVGEIFLFCLLTCPFAIVCSFALVCLIDIVCFLINVLLLMSKRFLWQYVQCYFMPKKEKPGEFTDLTTEEVSFTWRISVWIYKNFWQYFYTWKIRLYFFVFKF